MYDCHIVLQTALFTFKISRRGHYYGIKTGDLRLLLSRSTSQFRTNKVCFDGQ